jgi:Fe-S cluster assembly protein SufD
MALSVITKHPFGAAYAAQSPRFGGAWVEDLRRRGRARLVEGLPGPKVEEWRFTPLTGLARGVFVPAASAEEIDVQAVPFDVPAIAGAPRVVLVNGVFRPDLSDDLAGIALQPLEQAVSDGTLADVLGRIAPLTLPMVALNTAFLSGGLVMRATRKIAPPIHIISIAAAGDRPVAFHPRFVIDVAPGAAITLVESHVGLPGQPCFANPVTELRVAEDASVTRYVSVAEEGEGYHFATTVADVASRATLEAFHLGLGAPDAEATMRQEIHVRIDGPDARVALNGAYAVGGAAHHDFTTVIEHKAGGSASRQLFKGVLGGRAHGVYQGRIRVMPDAQRTDARQVHKALFLEAGPVLDCKPELEIDADDVQCAHGAASGALDVDQLFYLASRGLDPDTARSLLVEGFLGEALAEIRIEALREAFASQVAAWLRREQTGGRA